jgi:hypothetical protein
MATLSDLILMNMQPKAPTKAPNAKAFNAVYVDLKV